MLKSLAASCWRRADRRRAIDINIDRSITSALCLSSRQEARLWRRKCLLHIHSFVHCILSTPRGRCIHSLPQCWTFGHNWRCPRRFRRWTRIRVPKKPRHGKQKPRQHEWKLWPKFHLARLDTFDFVEPCFSNMADDEEAVALACTSLVFCALSVHVNKTEKRRHAVWMNDCLK